MKRISDCAILQNGVAMPWLGLGVWKVSEGNEVESSVKAAINAGYKSIDTAMIYKNEEGVGQAIRDSGVARNELFITTKVWNSDQGYESTLQAFEESRTRLGLDYVDLYLIHWPVKGKYIETWKAMEKLYEQGFVRAIGVSNFHQHHLEDILADCKVVPMVNQVECHPLLSQTELISFCKDKGIQMEAWSPLMQGNLQLPEIVEIAAKYGKSSAQIVLRWHLQNGVIVIPKSTNEARINENAAIFDFELHSEDMAAIHALNENRRFGADPDNFDF